MSSTPPAAADARPEPTPGTTRPDGVGAAPARLDDVVPAPVHVDDDPAGSFTLTAGTTVRATDEPGALAVADQLAALLRPATGFPLPVTGLPRTGTPPPDTGASLPVDPTTGPASTGDIVLTLDPDATDHGPEGYRLVVTADGVRISAAASAGLFYGVQTLRQLLPAGIEQPSPGTGPWVLPGGTVVDRPRFAYRGAMLDVCRHFFTVDEVLRVVDHLARYKLNHLHLHLTDDQGWRIAVDSWPRLGPVGGATQVGGGPGGHYSRADYQRIVAYAAARYVTVVPEIDLPGHTHAALVAYPELGRTGTAVEAYTGTEVGFSAVDTASELTYAFIGDVLREIAELTPGPYLHIGGDEAFTVQPAEYATFLDRVQPMVTALGRTVVGWHQVAPAAHEPDRVLQWWGTDPVDPVVADAVRRGARLILSPGNRTYLDMKYAADTPIGHDWAGLVEVHQAYDWDPATHLADVPAEAVLGVEAPLWTESVTTLAEVEFMLFPRLPALAEVGWSPRSRQDWAGFRQRLAGHGPRWTAAGITFHPSPEVP
ncbi:beta-N-acetylhexosaminidase, partial [Micromonospora echinofusca]|uniref:beta-N-acetylhexosaminidase n=1 Tax=Micromonospora echinofusca TaxID=47858 RepID=UPI0027DE34D3